jgi:hypothetical protein
MRTNTYTGFTALLVVLFLAVSPAWVFAIGTDITSITTRTISTSPFSIGGIAGDSQFAGGVFTLNFSGNVQSITGFTFPGGEVSTDRTISAKVYVRRSPVTDGRKNGYYQGVLDQTTSTFNFSSAGPLSEDELFDLNNILAGPDNVFTNTGANLAGVPYNGNVSIERLDFILEKKVKVNKDDKGKDKDDNKGVGFSIFERGVPTGHDGFGIAAITGVDELGHPTSYGPVYIIAAGSWGLTPLVVPIPQYYFLNNMGADHPGLPINPALTIPSNQTFGGVLIRADELVPSGQLIYGYSLFGPDVTCTSETLVNVADACFPKNTGAAGGIDLGAPNLGALTLRK